MASGGATVLSWGARRGPPTTLEEEELEEAPSRPSRASVSSWCLCEGPPSLLPHPAYVLTGELRVEVTFARAP